MNAEQLQSIRARRDAALPVNPHTAAASSVYSIPTLFVAGQYLPEEAKRRATRLAEFVNAAPADIDALIAEVDALAAELERVRAQLDAVPVGAINTVVRAATHAYDMREDRQDVTAITEWLRQRLPEPMLYRASTRPLWTDDTPTPGTR